MKLGLISCSKTKASLPCKAKEMHCRSTSFNLKVKYAEKHLDDWMILSTKYGVIDKDRIIEPYELCLSTHRYSEKRSVIVMNKDHIRKWKTYVSSQILSLRASIVYLTSKPYWEDLPKGETPLNGMKFGEQLKWLKESSKVI